MHLSNVSLYCGLCPLCDWVMFDRVSRIFLILLPAVKDTFSNRDSSELTVWAPWAGSTCLFFISPVCRVKLGHVNSPNWLQVFYFNRKIHWSFQYPFLYQPWYKNAAKQHWWSRVWLWCKHWFQWCAREISRALGSPSSTFPLPWIFCSWVLFNHSRPERCYQRYSQFDLFLNECVLKGNN